MGVCDALCTCRDDKPFLFSQSLRKTEAHPGDNGATKNIVRSGAHRRIGKKNTANGIHPWVVSHRNETADFHGSQNQHVDPGKG